MAKAIDLINQQFGDLTVIERAGSSSDHKALWLCRCSCGNSRIVLGTLLREGKITHCGCKNKTTAKNLLNQRFGRLVVIARDGSDNSKKALWKCKCNCGKEITARGSDLVRGKILSCGCYKTDLSTPNLEGKRFGRLTVIKRGTGNGKQMTWMCECDCGNEIEVTTSHLTSGNTQSCGCLVSKGENIIAEWLRNHQIQFQQQFTFQDLRGKNKNPLRFDFAIFKNNKLFSLLEYQGIQHHINIYNLSEEEYQYSLQRDELKSEYCKKNNILLLKIEYYENIIQKLEKFFNES